MSLRKKYSMGISYFNAKGSICRNHDLPALITNDMRYWYLNSDNSLEVPKFHRINIPAIIHPSGTKSWYFKGNYGHKNNKLNSFFPVTISTDGNKRYFYKK
jgi:hypothetical protein